MTQSVRGYREKVGEVRRRSELYLSSSPTDRHARAFIKVTLRHGIDHEFPPCEALLFSLLCFRNRDGYLVQVWPRPKACAEQRSQSIDYIWNGF